ncbi:MAG: HDIG domain-containing protein [Proteobacteria bacterium]|nr:HDIG domain-containing protein [Pseudomonadota bacterium]
MKSATTRFFKEFNLTDWVTKKGIQKFLLILGLSAIIGYLISPKIIFLPTIYKEGDIILQTIVIEEDLLIPDKVSTRLKKDEILKEQRPIYDFDPNVLEETKLRVTSSYRAARAQFKQLATQTDEVERKNQTLGSDYFSTVWNKHEIQKQTAFYRKYKAILKNRLEAFQTEAQLSAKGFEIKTKLDADLNSVNQMLDDLQEKLTYFQREQGRFGERFKKADEEAGTFKTSIAERKETAIRNFSKMLNIQINENEQQFLDFNYYDAEIESQLLVLLSEVLMKRIVISKNILPPKGKEKIEIRNVVSGEATKVDDLKDFLDVKDVRNLIAEVAKEFFPDDESGKKKNLILMLGRKLVSPTVTENKLEFEKRKDELITAISPVFFSVKKGEIIARTGDRATRHQVELIDSYYDVVSNMDKLPRMVGIVLIVFFSLVLGSFSFQLRGGKVSLTFKHLLLIMTSILITLLLIKGGVTIGDIVESRYTEIRSEMYNYMLPFALSSMLVGILINFEAALIAGLLTSMFASIMMQGNLYYFFFGIMGSIVASLPMTKFESRYSLLIHGLKISAVNLPMIVIIYLIESNQIGNMNWPGVGSAVLGGLLAAIITSILLPFFESIFDVTTNLKLLELSNMNHPALKELIFKAPGTYQHSLVVGNLADSGAMAIGANPLLARVASYYHDIGKTTDSYYFGENLSPNVPNIHDHIDPYASASIIIGHLEKGEKLADKFRLGQAIKDILLQHHGTRLVEFFFVKARDTSAEPGEPNEIDEKPFRYLGPKPQSLEAALVMLADVAETSSRSLENPTQEMIREKVESVCWDVLEDGQLNESGLTLQTYHMIVDVYCSILISFHHHRIKYPDKNDSASPNNSRLENSPGRDGSISS